MANIGQSNAELAPEIGSDSTSPDKSIVLGCDAPNVNAADLPADHYPMRQQLVDRVTIALTRSLWLLSAWRASESLQEMIVCASVGLIAACAYWVTGAVVKLVDDVVDKEDLDLPRAIRSGQVAPQHSIMIGLTAVACVAAAVAGQSQVAVVMMVAEVTGCLLAGKIDCWEHAVVMTVMWGSGVPILWANPMLLVRAACLVLGAGTDEMLKSWGKKHVADELASGYRLDKWAGTWAGEAWSWIVTFAISRNVTSLTMVAWCVTSGDWSHLVVLSFYGYEDAPMWYTSVCGWLGAADNASAMQGDKPSDCDPAHKASTVVNDKSGVAA